MEEARAQRLDRGLLRFVTIRAFRSCCAGEVWYLEAGTDAPRKHQQISSSLKTTGIEILECHKNRKHCIYSIILYEKESLSLFCVHFSIFYSIFSNNQTYRSKRHSRVLLSTTSLVRGSWMTSPDTLLHHLHLGIWCWTLWWCSFWAVGLETRDCNVFYGLKGWLWKCCTWFIGEMLYLLNFFI